MKKISSSQIEYNSNKSKIYNRKSKIPIENRKSTIDNQKTPRDLSQGVKTKLINEKFIFYLLLLFYILSFLIGKDSI